MIKVMICEDEKIYLEHLAAYINEYFQGMGEEVELRSFSDGAPLLDSLRQGAGCDLIFMDIQLEASDGVEMAKRIREFDKEVPIVFVTGLEDRVFEGYEVAALDYVVKHDMKDRLIKALDRFMENYGAQTLAIPGPDGTVIVRYADILWLESEGRGTQIGTGTGRLHSRTPVGQLAGKLPLESFVEIHKSIYVQTKAIRRIGADTVEMREGTVLPMSRRRRKAVMAAVMETVKE